MNKQHSIFRFFLAWLHGEVDASALEAYQRAGNIISQNLASLHFRYEHLLNQGYHHGNMPIHNQVEHVCLWNAFVLQTLGDQLLETDYRLNPTTIGYVSDAVFIQTQRFYSPVEAWLSRAHQAQHNPHNSLKDIDNHLPFFLPTWLTIGEVLYKQKDKKHTVDYVEGLLAAVETMVLTLEQEIHLIKTRNHSYQIDPKIQQIHAQIQVGLDYTLQLRGQKTHPALYYKVEQTLRRLTNQCLLLGQVLAMPTLLERVSMKQISFEHPIIG